MWIVQLCIIILIAAMCGSLAKRIGQSRVVGEITAGLVLGPSMLGAIGGDFYSTVFSNSVMPVISKLGELGLVFLMFQLGLHLDLKSLQGRTQMRVPVAVALMGIIIPFAIGCAIAVVSQPMIASEYSALGYVLFCGITLSISAMPVMARIVADLHLSDTSVATIALTAATLTDVLGWLMIAVIAAAAAGTFTWANILRDVVLLFIFVAVSMLIVRPLWISLFTRAKASGNFSRLMPAVVCYVLMSSWITAEIGVHSAFGALIAAMALRNLPDLAREWKNRVEGFVDLILMPVFFAYAGIQATLGNIPSSNFWPWFGLFLIGGIVGKFGGSYLGARVLGVKHHDACLIGSLMNTRGLMELVVLTIGLQLHLLPPAVYTMLVIMALVTTAMTVPTLRWLMRSNRQDMRESVEIFGLKPHPEKQVHLSD